jgi:hypothetical protein
MGALCMGLHDSEGLELLQYTTEFLLGELRSVLLLDAILNYHICSTHNNIQAKCIARCILSLSYAQLADSYRA